MAIYPGNVAVFSTKVDLTDTVFAEHVNALQDEVSSTQEVLGTNILTSTWATSYANPTTHASVSARMLNIEGGLRTLETGKLGTGGGTLTGALAGTSASFSGPVSASSLAGSGTAITALDAGNVSSGTLNWQRLQDSGVTPGTYAKVTVDAKGRVLSAGSLTSADLPSPLTATTAARWSTARTLTLSGDVAGSASIDGSSNVTVTTQIVDLPPDYTGGFFLGGM